MDHSTEQHNKCCFCGQPLTNMNYLESEDGNCLCERCIQDTHQIMCKAQMLKRIPFIALPGEEFENNPTLTQPQESNPIKSTFTKLPHPSEIKAHLDQYVIGQEQAKHTLQKVLQSL